MKLFAPFKMGKWAIQPLMKLHFIVLALLLSCKGEQPAVPAHKSEPTPTLAQNEQINDSMLKDAAFIIRNGDLVLRTGTDFSSEEVKTMSIQDKTYSHAGIAVKDSYNIFVFHIEPDYYHHHDKVRKELLDSFIHPARNYGFAIARYHLDEKQETSFIHYLEKQFSNKVAFDTGFNLHTDDSLYCSEMIRKGLAIATHNKLIIASIRFNDRNKFKVISQYLNIPVKNFINREIIPIDQLFLNPYCTILKRYLYTR